MKKIFFIFLGGIVFGVSTDDKSVIIAEALTTSNSILDGYQTDISNVENYNKAGVGYDGESKYEVSENNSPDGVYDDALSFIYSWDDWKDERGFSDDKNSIYYSMSPDALLALAEQGQDIYAMQNASYEYVGRGEDELSIKILKQAAEVGSIYALFMISWSATTHFNNLSESPQDSVFVSSAQKAFGLNHIDDPASLIDEVFMESLSYIIVASERGAVHSAKSELRNRLNSSTTEVTPELWRDVVDNSQIILEQLQQRRDYLGLDPFDNAPPKALVKKGWVDPNIDSLDVMKQIFFEYVSEK